MNMKSITNFWPTNEAGEWLCCICQEKMPDDYEPKACCSGYECGCMGRPTEPSICSDECWQEAMKGDHGENK